jgi:hypothetical protein
MIQQGDPNLRALREAREHEHRLEQEIAARDREAQRLRMSPGAEIIGEAARGAGAAIGMIVGTIALIVVIGVVGLVVVLVRSGQAVQVSVPSMASADTTAAPVLDPALQRDPFELQWRARVVSATGAAPGVGASCTLTATVKNGASVTFGPITFACGGTTLYDSRDALEGDSMTNGSITEGIVGGELSTFAYQMAWNDRGTRTGKRTQISIGTTDGEILVFRDAVPSFHVQAAIEKYSSSRQGKPINQDHVPPFDHLVKRTATVKATSGKLPFKGKTCDLLVSPASTTGDTCTVGLTCSGKVVFGDGSTGFKPCTVKAGEPVGLTDTAPTPKDGSPELQLDLTAGTATLADTSADGTRYSATFELK